MTLTSQMKFALKKKMWGLIIKKSKYGSKFEKNDASMSNQLRTIHQKTKFYL